MYPCGIGCVLILMLLWNVLPLGSELYCTRPVDGKAITSEICTTYFNGMNLVLGK